MDKDKAEAGLPPLLIAERGDEHLHIPDGVVVGGVFLPDFAHRLAYGFPEAQPYPGGAAVGHGVQQAEAAVQLATEIQQYPGLFGPFRAVGQPGEIGFVQSDL